VLSWPFVFRTFVFSCLVLFVFSWPAFPGQAALPGANGPRLELLATPPQLLEIVDIFVYAKADQAARGVARPNRFPSGTPQLTLDIRVKELKQLGTVIRFDVENASGRVEISDGFFSFARLDQESVSSMQLDLVPKSRPYADGHYQLKLYMNDVLVAVLNWTIG
jgi:hypothetical protein